jgi:hypothetical protein
MDDRRVAWLRARIAAHRSEAARLEVEVDAVLAARAVGVSQWRSDPLLLCGWAELPPELLAKVLELLQWQPVVCSAVRAVCSAWGDEHDALSAQRLQPRLSLAAMEGKLGLFASVTEVDRRAVKTAPVVRRRSWGACRRSAASRCRRAVRRAWWT